MTTFTNIGIILPTRGPTGSGHWADTDDANWALVDAHNHQNGKGLPINSAALTIDGDVSFSSLWAVTNMQRVSFAAVTALSANNKSIFVSSADNELYWRTNTGANVKLTSGSTLNVGAFVGGIGGDYTSVGAQLNFDDGGKRYTLKEGTADSNGWAKIACGGIRLAEFNTTETLYVEQLAPAALAGTYTMTWPTALPANAQAVQIDNAGQFSFSNTFAQAATFSAGANIGAQFLVTGTISPAALTDSLSHNDYNPTGLSTANVIRQSVTGTSVPTLSGLAGGVDGRQIVLHALGAVAGDHLTLSHEDAASAAANRFSLSGATSLTLLQFSSVHLVYDGTSSRWRVIGKNF